MTCKACNGRGFYHCGDANSGVSYPCKVCEQAGQIREILGLIDELGGGLLDEDPVTPPPGIIEALVERGHLRRARDDSGWMLTREGLAYVRWVLRMPLPDHLDGEHTKMGRI